MKSLVSKNIVLSMVLAVFLSVFSVDAVSYNAFKQPVHSGTIIKHFLVTPSIQELLRSKIENNMLVEKGVFNLSMHEITNMISACLVNCIWASHVDEASEDFAAVIKRTCCGEAAYKLLVTLGKVVGFNQSLSAETRQRVATLVAPFLKEVLAEMVHEVVA